MNRALVAYQLAFNHVYQQCEKLIDGVLRAAVATDFRGYLDLKSTQERGKLRVTARLRKPDAAPPRGQWFTLPVVPEVLAEFFDRIEPEPEPNDVREVDASKAPATDPADPGEAARARLREAKALEGNIRRSKQETGGIDWTDAEEAIGKLKAALE